jgi:glycosyltransferase involved in cell wall biosynthesis
MYPSLSHKERLFFSIFTSSLSNSRNDIIFPYIQQGRARLKIALINSEYPSSSGADHGGIATYTYTLANLLVQYGHTVHLLTRSGIHPEEILQSVHIHHISFKADKRIIPRVVRKLHRSEISWEKGLAFCVKEILLQILKNTGLDIVEYPEYGGLGIYCHKIPQLPSVVTLHTPSVLVDELNFIIPNPDRYALYRLEEKSIKKATACKCPSNALKNYACDQFALVTPRVSIIHNPFNINNATNIFYTSDKRNIPRFDILFSGRLEYRKGADILLRSIKSILAISDRINFTIAGETEIPGHQNYRYAIEHILSPEERLRVWFLGPVPHKMLLPLYKNSSLFLFPSLFENSPYALLEAMACGIPVVAAVSGGVSEIIKHGENGFMFSPTDPQEPAALIASLFKDKELSFTIGQNAAASIVNKYNIDTTVNEYISFYQSVIDSVALQ